MDRGDFGGEGLFVEFRRLDCALDRQVGHHAAFDLRGCRYIFCHQRLLCWLQPEDAQIASIPTDQDGIFSEPFISRSRCWRMWAASAGVLARAMARSKAMR